MRLNKYCVRDCSEKPACGRQARPQALPVAMPKLYYCVKDILTCTPALVFTVGAEEEMYGLTRR